MKGQLADRLKAPRTCWEGASWKGGHSWLYCELWLQNNYTICKYIYIYIYREWKYNGPCKAYTKGMYDEAYGAAF